MQQFRLWWHAPRLRTENEGERRVSWLELFYDLVFVVMIARLAHYLAYHNTSDGVLAFVLLFVPVWWVWIGNTIYNDRFETYDVSYRVTVFLQILAVAVMSVFIEGGLDKHADAFALSYAAARFLLVLMWWRGGRHNPIMRPVTMRYNTGFSLSIVLWIASTFVDGPISIAMKGLGLVIDLITPIFTISHQRALPRFSSKLTERYGLFMIIVLGESIVSVLNGVVSNETIDWASLLRVGLGIALSFGLWWIYFDFIGRRVPNRANPWRGLGWSYLHLPLVMGVTALAASILHAISLKTGALEPETRWILIGAYAVVMLSMGLIERTLIPEKIQVVNTNLSSNLKIVTAVVAVLFGLLGDALTTGVVLAFMVALNLGHMLYGAISWFSSPVSRMAPEEEV